MTPLRESHELAGQCAGCGAETTSLDGWASLHDTLLCPDCRAAIEKHSSELEAGLSRAEREWTRLWREVDHALAGAA